MKNQILFFTACTLISSICLANDLSHSIDANAHAQTALRAQTNSQEGSVALTGSLQQQGASTDVIAGTSDAGSSTTENNTANTEENNPSPNSNTESPSEN